MRVPKASRFPTWDKAGEKKRQTLDQLSLYFYMIVFIPQMAYAVCIIFIHMYRYTVYMMQYHPYQKGGAEIRQLLTKVASDNDGCLPDGKYGCTTSHRGCTLVGLELRV